MLDHQVLSALLEKYRGALGKPVRTFALGGRLFDFNRYRYLVGVINLSTDSWDRESVCATTAEAIARAEMLHTDGADIIDIGAESTLPHARQADMHQQLERLLPVVEALKARRLLVSVESYYPEVLETCAKAGADIFNLTATLYGEDIILPHAPEIFLEDERRAAEPFFSVLALLGGTHVIRSHEVRTVHRIRQVMDLYES